MDDSGAALPIRLSHSGVAPNEVASPDAMFSKNQTFTNNPREAKQNKSLLAAVQEKKILYANTTSSVLGCDVEVVA